MRGLKVQLVPGSSSYGVTHLNVEQDESVSTV